MKTETCPVPVGLLCSRSFDLVCKFEAIAQIRHNAFRHIQNRRKPDSSPIDDWINVENIVKIGLLRHVEATLDTSNEAAPNFLFEV